LRTLQPCGHPIECIIGPVDDFYPGENPTVGTCYCGACHQEALKVNEAVKLTVSAVQRHGLETILNAISTLEEKGGHALFLLLDWRKEEEEL
jgi:uncharacterized protein (DUF2237 family)